MHGRCHDATFASDWLVAEVIYHVLLVVHFGVSGFDGILKLVEELKISLLEDVGVWILVRSRSKPNSVYSKKRSKLVLEIVLFKVGSGVWRNPKLLGRVCDLNIHESEGAEQEEHESTKHGCQWISSRHQP